MRCSKCGTEGIPGKKFCAECGSPFSNRCSNCNSDNAPGAKFCADCGGALGTDVVADRGKPSATEVAGGVRIAPERQTSETVEGERKTVTALFADIKDSTEMMRDLDPEEARAIVDPALRIMVDAVRRYDGYVVQSTGDGIFALFGAPAAYEDHPQRSLYAALQMQQRLREHGQRLAAQGRPALQARIGVNTGEVVVRTIETGGKVEYTPIGHTANLAARLQTIAPAGSIAVSEDTRRLVEGYFELRPLGPAEIKGISESVNVYEVTGLGPLRTHFQLSARRGLTKFVGRANEMAALGRAMELARSGHGQVAAIVAEAGSGKSRLVYEFKATLPGERLVLEAYSVSHGGASPYQPVLDLLHGYFGIVGTDEPDARRERVSSRLAALDPNLADTRPYLLALLGIQDSPESLAQMDPQVKRRRTLDAIKRIVLRESLKQPLVIIFEDLHWIDVETQALLDLLADGLATARILLLVNYRPEYRHEWGNKTYYAQLRLDALGRESAAEMLSTLLGDGVELNPLKRLIFERTEGNPFFIEEMVQALFDQGALVRNGEVKVARPLSQLRLPATVQGILAARIDGLPGEPKQLLQTLAVIGKESPLALIRKVVATPEPQLERMLADLQVGEFIYEQASPSELEYTFKHALTLEVAYNSLLIERRKVLHERAASAMESLYADRINDHLAELARHYERTANLPKALEYLERAGQQAAGRSAHAEAIGLFNSARELLKTMPETPNRIEQELTLQLSLGVALQCIKGWAAPEVGEVYARARELCSRMGDAPQAFATLAGLWVFHLVRAEHDIARELAEQLLSIAERRRDASLFPHSHHAMGATLHYQGELASARTHLDRAVSLYDPVGHPMHALHYFGFDVAVNSFDIGSQNLWILGYPGQAQRAAERGLSIARELSHSLSLAHASDVAAVIHLWRGEGEAALKFNELGLRLASEHGFQQWFALSTCIRGGVLLAAGQLEEGIEQLREGLASLWASGAHIAETGTLAALATAYGRLGRTEEGLATITEALAAKERTGECHFEAELHRLKGELLQRGRIKEPESRVREQAEACFRRAIEVAQRQLAKSWELRATMSLARLLAKQGNRTEARAMLAEIYNWFTEGFDTADLKDAKVLLEELGA